MDVAKLQHDAIVTKIQKEIAATSGEFSLKRKASCCSRSYAYKSGKTPIDLSALTNILEINTKEKYVVVEPMVTMEALTRATLAHELTIAVTPEFRQMTIGGAIQGLGGESSSFKFGLIDECVLEYELVLADGTLITASKDGDHADLFHALTGSYGSLAVITKIKLRLQDAAKYVRIVYERVQSITEVYAAFKQAMSGDIDFDFIECVAIAKNDFRIARGYKTNHISLKNYLFHRCSLKYFWSPWYYNHLAEKTAETGYEEYMSYEDFLFRWDRGGFWLGLILLQIIGRYQHSLFNRLFFGKLLQCESLYKMLDRLPLQGREQAFLMQDLLVPGNETETFFNFLDNLVGIYPLWFIPIKPPQAKKIFSLPHDADEMYVDFGLWGFQRSTNSISVNREIELFLQKHQGRKWLWNQSYFKRHEFWQTYDNIHYQQLREKYKAENRLVDIYEKVTEYYRSIATE